MAAKFYTRNKVINGVEYKAQFSGLSVALNALDESYIDGSSNIGTMKFNQYVLDNAIVEPKGLDVDSFDSIDELNAVVKFGREVMQGNFRDKTDENTTKEKNKG